MNHKVLSIMQLPPPVHGQSAMNQLIYESSLINSSFEMRTIPLRFTELDQIGKPSVSKLIKMGYFFTLILKELVRFKPDMVYFTLSPNGFAFYRDAIYVFFIKLFGIRIVYHLHGKGIKKASKNIFNAAVYAFVFKNTKIIFLSRLLINDLESVFTTNSQNTFCLPNGIKVQNFLGPKIKKKLQDAPTILFLSNIDISKGVYVLLEAAKILFDKNIKFRIIFIGGILKTITGQIFLNKIAELGLDECVEYLGPKYGYEKFEYLYSADIFVFPTFYTNEAFPLVLLEAMQAGLPVISTYEGAIPEIIDNNLNGFLVTQRNPSELAEKIEILINSPEKRLEFGLNGRKKFYGQYTDKIFEKNLIDIFNRILYEC